MVRNAEITVGGKIYNVSVNTETGERLIEGCTIDEFMDSLPYEDVYHVAILGKGVVSGAVNVLSQQKIMNELHQVKNN